MTNPQRREAFARVKKATAAIAEVSPVVGGQADVQVNVIGTGFFVHGDGVLLTAKHVVEGWTKAVTAGTPVASTPHVLWPHTTGVAATGGFQLGVAMVPVRQIILHNQLDLAALKIVFPSPQEGARITILEPCTGAYEDGDEIALCGYPFGNTLHREIYNGALVINSSFSTGIVSAVFPFSGAPLPLRKQFQIDAMVNGGNSGGPVFDPETGAVLGVVVSTTSVSVLAPQPGGDPGAAPIRIGVSAGLARAVDIQHARTIITSLVVPPGPAGQ
jgi:S1-C subfamily serine protease